MIHNDDLDQYNTNMCKRSVILVISLFVFSPSIALALCVQNEFANLRKGPGTSFEKTWKVFRYMPLEKKSKKDGWYEVVDMEKRSHWIREDLVTTAYECAAISTDLANLRTGPGRKYPKAKPAQGMKYLSFRVLKKEGDWVQIEDAQGDEAWIHGPLVWIR